MLYGIPASADVNVRSDVHTAGPEDLEVLSTLLATPNTFEQRLNSGDVCLWAEIRGRPVGLAWLNLATHTDRHFGKWSLPTKVAGYLNQVIIVPEYRGFTVASWLLHGVQRAAYEAGRQEIRTIRLKQNSSDHVLLERFGGRQIGQMRGLRFGKLGTLRWHQRTQLVGLQPP